MSFRADIELYLAQMNAEFHQYIIVKINILNFFQGLYRLLIDLLEILLPLEGCAYLLNIILEFDKDSLHNLGVGCFDDIDLLVNLFLKDYKVAIVND